MELLQPAARAAALTTSTLLLTTACAGAADPAKSSQTTALTTDAAAATSTGEGRSTSGTQPQEHVTLTLGNALMDMPDQLVSWGAEVRRQTGESITFKVLSEYGQASSWDDREQLLLEAVATGEVDMAWVGARALTPFEPLLAPMLVDSHHLQEEVFAAGIPEQMLAEVRIEGVTGLGVLPGPHRRLLGVTRDFRAPEHFADAIIMGDRNAMTLDTLKALGAAEVAPGVEGVALEGLDGLVAQVGAVVGNNYQGQARSFTTNLNLWPRPLVLVANTSVLEGLSDRQRGALLEAAEATFQQQMEITRQQDALPVEARLALCSSPLQLVELSDEQLAALEDAVEPVLEEARKEEAVAGHLEAIEQLKADLDTPPDKFSCEAQDS